MRKRDPCCTLQVRLHRSREEPREADPIRYRGPCRRRAVRDERALSSPARRATFYSLSLILAFSCCGSDGQPRPDCGGGSGSGRHRAAVPAWTLGASHQPSEVSSHAREPGAYHPHRVRHEHEWENPLLLRKTGQ